MTTTTETPVPDETVARCRKCHQKITMLGGDWTDTDGLTGCMFPPVAQYHPHEPEVA